MNNKSLCKTIRFFLIITFLAAFASTNAQSKYSISLTTGPSASDTQEKIGINFGIELERHLWKFVNIGLYFDHSKSNNYMKEMNKNNGQNPYFIPSSLDKYIRSLGAWDQLFLELGGANYWSFGIKGSTKFNITQKLRGGLLGGMGITRREYHKFFISKVSYEDGILTEYIPATTFANATELSFRYGFNFDYTLSNKLNLLLNLLRNSSVVKGNDNGDYFYYNLSFGINYKL